jgi:hypothetical protein
MQFLGPHPGDRGATDVKSPHQGLVRRQPLYVLPGNQLGTPLGGQLPQRGHPQRKCSRYQRSTSSADSSSEARGSSAGVPGRSIRSTSVKELTGSPAAGGSAAPSLASGRSIHPRSARRARTAARRTALTAAAALAHRRRTGRSMERSARRERWGTVRSNSRARASCRAVLRARMR